MNSNNNHDSNVNNNHQDHDHDQDHQLNHGHDPNPDHDHDYHHHNIIMDIDPEDHYSTEFKARKDDLIMLISKAHRDDFAEELYFYEKLGGQGYIENGLRVNSKYGIQTSEIENRQKIFGSNERKKIPPKRFWSLVWDAFDNLTLKLLTAAAIISIVIDEITADPEEKPIAWIEGFAILIAVFVSVLVTAITDFKRDQEFQRINNIAESRRLITVLRDSKLMEVNSTQVVVGDIIKLYEGMEIPADGFLIQGHEITIDESAMTGETDPIRKATFAECIKERDDIIQNGEDQTADKHVLPSPILISGTRVLTGEGLFVVIMVGENSSIGKIGALIVTDIEATPLQQKLEKIARDIGLIGLIAATLTLLVLVIRFLVEMGIHDSWSEGYKYQDLIEYFLIAIAVLVVAIPEGLPVAVTLALAFSVRQMMTENNLVRRLEACETMGNANNICSDKTGTLTQNKMTLTKIWNTEMVDLEAYQEGYDITNLFTNQHYIDMLMQGFACNSSASLNPLKGSKTDIAMLEFVKKCGVDIGKLRQMHLVEGYFKIPFSSARKRQTTLCYNVQNGLPSKQRLHIKGASELVLDSCSHVYLHQTNETIQITPDMKNQLNAIIYSLANQALRTICLAYKDIVEDEDFTTKDEYGVYDIEKHDLTLFAICGVRDLLRPGVKEAINKCKKAGIKVRMVTGDNKVTATAIARECGISDPNNKKSLTLEGKEFQTLTGGVVCSACRTKICDCPRTEAEAKETKKKVRVDTIANPQAFDEIIEDLDVLARSQPQDKYALVTGLKERDHVVAVTGDGTNDAPALKKANVGFAMGIAGTEVAKEAAAIILLDDNFTTIVAAVLWGRNIYDSIRKFLMFQLTINIVAALIILIGAAILKQPVLAVVQLLWVNLVMDTLAALALATEPPRSELLDRKPYKKSEYIISRKMTKQIVGQAIYQMIVMMVVIFAGDYFIPEFLTEEDGPPEVIWSAYNFYGEQKYVRSGRLYMIDGDTPDYKPYLERYGPSRHFTFVFNVFVVMQIFNFFNARRLNDEFNIFSELFKSKFFIIILLIVIGGQLILGNLGGRPLNVSLHGMDVRQWLIAIAFGVGVWVNGFLLKFIPAKVFKKYGKDYADPIRQKSIITSIKRAQSGVKLHRKFSSPRHLIHSRSLPVEESRVHPKDPKQAPSVNPLAPNPPSNKGIAKKNTFM